MTNLVRCFIDDQSGATAIEYGLIAAGIAVAIIVAVNTVGTDLSSLFGRVLYQAQRGRNQLTVKLAKRVGRAAGAFRPRSEIAASINMSAMTVHG